MDNIKVLTGQTPTTSSPKKKILIVEDEKPLQKVLSDRFEQEGFEVLTADNGQDGLENVKANHPHAVLLDLLMPVMSGQNMLRQLREIEEFKTLPVVVLTNAGDVENIHQTKTFNNAAAFLIKSNVSMSEIVQTVKLILGIK